MLIVSFTIKVKKDDLQTVIDKLNAFDESQIDRIFEGDAAHSYIECQLPRKKFDEFLDWLEDSSVVGAVWLVL